MPHIKYNPDLPEPIINALKESVFEYSKARRRFLKLFAGQYDYEFSVTDLTTPTKILWLKRWHKDELVIDLVKDNYYSLLGSSMHSILEKYAPAHCIVEDRQHAIFNFDGIRVLFHGQPDLYDPNTGVLDDYKHTSATSVMYDKWEYEFQLNANKYLFELRGNKVKRIRNIYLFRYLDKQQIQRNANYPNENIYIKEFSAWQSSVTENRIKELIKDKLSHLDSSDRELPDCTSEERWARDSHYAIEKRNKPKKKGEVGEWGKTAWTTRDTIDECNQLLNDAPPPEETRIVFRPGNPTRCIDFCPVSPWCAQRQKEIKEMNKKKESKKKIFKE